MLGRLTHNEWHLQGLCTSNLGYRFDPATCTSKPDITTNYRYLKKPELSPEDLWAIKQIRENEEGLAREVVDSLVRGVIKSKLKGVSPGPDGSACAVGLEKSMVELAPGPGPGPGVKKAVAAAPKKRAKVRRLNVAPADVVKEGKRLELWACWLVIFRQLYRRSRFGKLQDVPHYPRPTERKGRYYFCGNNYLARITGLNEWTVRQVLHDLEEAKLIYIRYQGYKGRGCSIIELPVNMRLVWKWRREHKGLKLSTLLSGGGV
ncbi:hypothetical protein ES703_109598 [subsurface metagenome]